MTTPSPEAERDDHPVAQEELDQETGTTQKRERKKTTDLYQPTSPTVTSALVIAEGHGTKLRDIPNVNFKLGKLTGRDELIEDLHNVLYKRRGVLLQRKKAILDFSGFAFEESAKDKEVASRTALLGKLNLDTIHRMLDTLDVPRGSGSKEDKIDALLKFLQEPGRTRDSDLAAQAAKKRNAATKKREASRKKQKVAAKTKTSAIDPKDGPAVEEEAIVEANEIDKVPSEQLKTDIETILQDMSSDELSKLTSKQIVGRLTDHYGFEARPRKLEIAGIAQAYALAHIVEEPRP